MTTLTRLHSIDLMRGFVIALMALDHTRDFFSNAPFSPLDLEQTNAGFFLTRWVTHLCAPTFVFLAGVSAYLASIRHGMSSRQLAWYLLTRGLWLVVLELTVVHFGWTFNWDFHRWFGQVIWALGWSMVALAGLVFLPRPAIWAIALAMIFGHNLFDSVDPASLGTSGWLWTILHVPGDIEWSPGFKFHVSYPLIPWIGVMAAGYCFAPLFLQPEQVRRTWLLWLGVLCLLIFLVLRLPNLYGDPQLWMPQKDWLFSVFAIMDCKKYPPSLLYALMTLGIMFIGLWLFESQRIQRVSDFLRVFGRVPIFFYVLHLPLIHGGIFISSWLRGFPIDGPFPAQKTLLTEYGYDLPAVYGFWLLFLGILYPLCLAYGRLKQRYPKSWWVSYL